MSRPEVRPGLFLLISLLACYLAFQWGRGFFLSEESPAFVFSGASAIWIELGDGFPDQGTQQIFDALTPLDVINLTRGGNSYFQEKNTELNQPLESGERLDLRLDGPKILGLKRSWMGAAKRITLGIPLHPDRMSRSDWECLLGIGPALAEKIEKNRQKFGDFGSFQNLRRVKGVGPKRLAGLREFFSRR